MRERDSKNPDTEVKREAYRKLCEGEPEAIFILSGGIIKNSGEKFKNEGVYKSGSYASAVDFGLISGGKARSIAAAELADSFPKAPVVTLSRTSTEQPSHASVIASEVARKGVARQRIIEDEESYSTLTELFEVVRLIRKNQWKQAAVISNEYQIPRAKVMLEMLTQLRDKKGHVDQPEIREALEYYDSHREEVKLVFVAAEDVLPVRDKKYAALINNARKTDLWKQKEQAEAKGINDLKSGSYK